MSTALQAILDNPRYHDYLAILKGARNGFVYGVKVRFPHALIMAILFGRGEYVSYGGRCAVGGRGGGRSDSRPHFPFPPPPLSPSPLLAHIPKGVPK
jgi:hypothetical protein